jgi:hypothetical protein
MSIHRPLLVNINRQKQAGWAPVTAVTTQIGDTENWEAAGKQLAEASLINRGMLGLPR